MSGLWTSAFESAGSHLSAGWFWLFPLLFAIHDAEEAAYVWTKGSLRNSISYITLNVPQTMAAILFELTIFMAAAAWATEPGASHLAIFTFAVLLGGYTAHGFVHLYLGWRAHQYTLGVATALPFVVFHLRQTHRNRDPELDVGGSQLCSRGSSHVALDPCCSPGRFDLGLRSAVLRRARRSDDAYLC